MFLEIVTPEATLFTGEVDSLSVPGVSGEFQMLNNHAPIVSTLKSGYVKIYGSITLDKSVEDNFTSGDDNGTWLSIHSGTIEMNGNKVIVLAD
jgi:F-type H+-transporting ATPase subunit epsilon